MDTFLRSVKKTPSSVKDQNSQKHSKIPEGWGNNKEPVAEGITFFLKYIGSTLVEELEGDETYGDGISAKAVHNIIVMARAANKKLLKTSLTISGKGIRTVDLSSKQVMFDISIYRVCFCTADKSHDKVFAYIARNTTNETMECHAFLCAKTKIAQAVTLTVSQAFSVAQDRWLEQKKLKRAMKQEAQGKKESAIVRPMEEMNQSEANLISLSPSTSPVIARPRPRPSGAQTNASPSKKEDVDCRKNWEIFEDSDGEDIDDFFSQLAKNRSERLPSFGTDLVESELDNSVKDYMSGSASYEAFSRQKSVEDLLNL